jgi:hypothetical protein
MRMGMAVLVAMVMIMRVLMVSLMPMVVRHLDHLSVQVLLALGAKQASWPCWLRACVGMVRQPLPDMVGVVFRLLSEHLVRC